MMIRKKIPHERIRAAAGDWKGYLQYRTPNAFTSW